MKKSKIYVASSWRNEHQPTVIEVLRLLGHEVYDFRNPAEGNNGFSWSSIDPNWQEWTTEQYMKALEHPTAIDGFNHDFNAMKWADTCVMLLPCGRSANTEAGWMKGAGKAVFVLQLDKQEPELMYKIYDGIISSIEVLAKEFIINESGSNPFNCFGRKPHRMDFDDQQEFEDRLRDWTNFEATTNFNFDVDKLDPLNEKREKMSIEYFKPVNS